MIQGTFRHLVDGNYVESTVILCGRRRWRAIKPSGEWASLRFGRLILALRLRSDATNRAPEKDDSLVARFSAVGRN